MNKVERMDLRQVVDWLYKNGSPRLASTLEKYRNSKFTVNEWFISKELIESELHCIDPRLIREIECDCTTYIMS